MLELLVVIGRALALAVRGHRELVLENSALRQQLTATAMKRTTRRPHLQIRDRLFWVALKRIRQNWRTALVLVQPDTVVRFQIVLRDFARGARNLVRMIRIASKTSLKLAVNLWSRSLATFEGLDSKRASTAH